MPLPLRNLGNLNEEPLTSSVFKAGLDDSQFHSATRVNEHLGKFRLFVSTILAIHPLSKVSDGRPNCEPPALIAKTMPCGIKWKRIGVVRLHRITDKAASRMCVKGKEEEKCQMVGVPEGFKALSADLVMCSCIHQQHHEQHKMSSDSTCLCVVNLQGSHSSNLCCNVKFGGQTRKICSRVRSTLKKLT